MEELLSEIYYDSSHPASYGGAHKLYKYAKLINPFLKLSEVQNWLSSQNTYTLHKFARRRFTRNKIYVFYIDEQWECDLVDMRRYSRQNRGYNYILTAIDCFSKYLFAIPTKTKTSIEIITVFKKIFKNRKPNKLRSDRGGEFDNKLFKAFCQRNQINYFTTQDKNIKCAIIERANRTLKEKMFRYFTHKGTRKYLDILDSLVNSYNNTVHSVTKMTPINVDESDETIIFENIYKASNMKEILFKNRYKHKLKVGDDVRKKYDLNALEKSYYPLWTNQIYKIAKVLGKTEKPQYVIETGGDKELRRFYPEELQKVTVDDNTYYGVEKVLKRRSHNGEQQVLVKWLNFPSKFNQWIPATYMRDL